MFLSEPEKTRLREHIQQTERGSSGEIVTVIAKQSDGYRYIPLLWSTLCALAVPGVYYLYQVLLGSGWTYPGEDSETLALLYQVQALVFFTLAMLFSFTRLGLWVIPSSVKYDRAAQTAAQQFYEQGVHTTDARAGILVFVSVAEHYVEIIVDSAIANKVDNQVWQTTIDGFVRSLRQGEIVEGFEETLEQCRSILWEHFPGTISDSNELPDHLIEI